MKEQAEVGWDGEGRPAGPVAVLTLIGMVFGRCRRQSRTSVGVQNLQFHFAQFAFRLGLNKRGALIFSETSVDGMKRSIGHLYPDNLTCFVFRWPVSWRDLRLQRVSGGRPS